MNTTDSYNVIIFLNSSFYTKKIDKIIEPFIKEQKVISYLFSINTESELDLSHWEEKGVTIEKITSEFTPPILTEDTFVIDALFGFELSSPITGGFAAVVRLINNSKAPVLSIGAPSGLLANDNTNNPNIIKANYSVLFDNAPLSCYFDENQKYLGDWSIISTKEDSTSSTNIKFTSIGEISSILKQRSRFCHKGTFGHGLLIAGSIGMAGACTMAAQAALKSGIGLLTLHIPQANRAIHQIAVPQAMLDIDSNEYCFSQLLDISPFSSVAVGPGIGLAEETEIAFKHLLMQNKETKTPLILDADALNLLSSEPHLFPFLKDCILTPHKVELERIIGECNNSYIRLTRALEFAKKYNTYLILKGAYSILVFPDGKYQLNPTGNEGMATGGSGDVLTGVLLALRCQGYTAEESIILGAYIHGYAGDLAKEEYGNIAMTAADIISYLPLAWKKIVAKVQNASLS